MSRALRYHHNDCLVNRSSSPLINNCTISANRAGDNGGGIHCWLNSSPKINNCIISANISATKGGGIYCTLWCHPLINNCTIYANTAPYGGGIHCRAESYPTIINSIMWADTPTEIYDEDSPPQVMYTDLQGGWPGLGNIDEVPLFARPGYWDPNSTPTDPNDDFWVEGDYHLQSSGWRWDAQIKRWRWDYVTSRCIDAGNPGMLLGDELLSIPNDPDNIWGENMRINMGAFGGTAEASMGPVGGVLRADLTNDGVVNLKDYAHLVRDWLKSDPTQPGDLNRDGSVDIFDLDLLLADWLKITPWY